MPKRSLHKARERLQEDARQIAMKAGVDVVPHLVETDDIESVIRPLAEIGADLLVIGTHKPQPDLSSPWSGTAYGLAQHAPCSVLDVRVETTIPFNDERRQARWTVPPLLSRSANPWVVRRGRWAQTAALPESFGQPAE